MGYGERIDCPDCGMRIERKNLAKHYRRAHPDLDPYERMKEARKERPPRKIREIPSSTVARVFIILFVAAILIAAGLLALSVFQRGGESLEPSRNMFYTASDGAIINGTFYPSSEKGAETVYLIHDIGEDRTVWNDYAMKLQEKGYNVLAIDLRGHGTSTLNIKSSDITYDWTVMDHEDMMGIMLDVQGAYKWVHGEDIDGNRNTDAGEMGAMIGVGRGGLFALSQVARMSREKMLSATIISPTLTCYDLDVPQIFQDFGDVRPVMLAASEGDTIAGKAIDTVMAAKEADGENNGFTYYVQGDGTGMALLKDEGLQEKILEIMEMGWSLGSGP
ncbi:MAG TPA: hypothetical protein ENK47_00955 [Euryarchaeota archaeon]|nr:MAG: hypothetical protein DRN57_03760 [Thermoplasmata archaeon]HHD15258.1 hypothetical protein [Euryarchaeota archaeon]